MNTLLLGSTIAALRKSHRLTQAALAEVLDVSNKTVSKWETGLSYPEIALLPQLASVFGVTVDYLLSGERNGIAVAGNHYWITARHLDSNFRVTYAGRTVSIMQDVSGAVPNITMNLAKIDPAIPLAAIGCVGNDENGRRILAKLQYHYIQTKGVLVTNTATGTTDTLIEPRSDLFRVRTVGANELFDPTHIDITSLNCRLFHFDRLYLPRYWDPDAEYGSKLARTLHDLQEAGIETSVSAFNNAYRPTPEQTLSILKYCDYLIINNNSLYSPEDGGPYTYDPSNPRRYMQWFIDHGVGKKVYYIIDHSAGFCLSKDGRYTSAYMHDFREEDVVSIFGGADDVTAGCLYGIYQGYTDKETLEFALATIAVGLQNKYTADGMPPKKEICQYIPKARKNIAP